MSRRWEARDMAGNPRDLADALGIPLLLATHLCRRGVSTPEEGARFLAPRLLDMLDPMRMAGMQAAVERLVRAVRNKESVGLCGDYDVDGVTSTTLMTEVLQRFGVNPALYIPHRIRDGYGLNHEAVKTFAARGTRLLITLDCGVTAVSEVQAAVEAGMDVVVIDHHTVPVTLPPAVAVLNPHRTDCAFAYKQLCAVGVTFYLCVALRKALREAGLAGPDGGPDLKEFLDLVALGTIADLVPLTGQNRILVTAGLKVLQQNRRVGLKALMAVSNVDPATADAGTVGFQLGPRINAAGRLQDAMVGVRMLLSPDLEEATRLATVLNQENLTRRETQQRTVDEALVRAREPLHLAARALVLYDEAWHPGVVGIAAQKIVDAFRSALYAHAQTMLTPEDLIPRSHHDGPLPLGGMTDTAMEMLGRAAPFGRGNSEPCFLVENVGVKETRVVGKTGEHLQLWFGGSQRAIAFRLAPHAQEIQQQPCDFLITPKLETWNGTQRVGLQVRDWRPFATGGVP